MVQTARGVIDAQDLGVALVHEHVLNVNAELVRDQRAMSWGDDEAVLRRRIVDELRRVAASGVDTIVDCTVFGHGRDVAFVADIAREVDLNILVATGIYTFDHLPHRFDRRGPTAAAPRDALTELFVRDIVDGVAGTGVHAAIIKFATDRQGVTPRVDRVIRAAAAAHLETGVPITTHSFAGSRNGLDQQRILLEEGVDLSRVVIGHCGDTQDLDYLRALMDGGSFIGADRFGLYLPGYLGLAERVDVVATLCAEGYADRILLSHDYTIYSDWFSDETLASFPAEWSMTHIPDAVLPAMRRAGIADADIDRMLVDNPRRLFADAGAD